MKLINKILTIVKERPEQIFPHLRSAYLFYQTYILRKFIFPYHANIHVEKNVRVQSFSIFTRTGKAKISIGENTIIYENAKIECYELAEIKIGKNSIVGDAKIISRANIQIGDNFLTSWNVFIQDFDPHPTDAADRKLQVENICNDFFPRFDKKKNALVYTNQFKAEQIIIGHNVWMGANTTILKGAKIGNNCIIATGAVVLRGTYPDNAILAGNPAKIVKITE